MLPGRTFLKLLTFVAFGCSHGKSLLIDFLSLVFRHRRQPLLATPTEMVSRPTDDTVLCPHPALDDGPTLKDIIIDSGCKVLAELSDATESSGDVRFSSCFAGTKLTQKMKETQRTTYGFDRRRTIMFTGGTEAFQNGFWLRKTKKVMKELNAEVPCIPSTAKGSFRFLDLG